MKVCLARIIRRTRSFIPEDPVSFLVVLEISKISQGKENNCSSLGKRNRSFLVYGYNVSCLYRCVAYTFKTEMEAIHCFDAYYHERPFPNLHKTSDWLVKPLLLAGIHWRDISDTIWVQIKVFRRISLCV
ncbi:MAG: hypothetical protein UY07_C0021G0014 [Parcubacteria group bacterium GW2011_GWA1_47_8]|nr:MAG: hypothetical protein UY07_C0021G0014 [Parcubacteria group bacterium GW2011_GWA1_47_8]KKW08050.1 MAG: hypothetical protein UY42_C0001G0013 [Parcubacteria group bacterium GW2011_GWA2_49_16]